MKNRGFLAKNRNFCQKTTAQLHGSMQRECTEPPLSPAEGGAGEAFPFLGRYGWKWGCWVGAVWRKEGGGQCPAGLDIFMLINVSEMGRAHNGRTGYAVSVSGRAVNLDACPK